MSIYYTTYDLRRGKDRVNMRGQSNIMTLSQADDHPYAYARVLGMFRVDVLHGPTMSNEVRMDFGSVGSDLMMLTKLGGKQNGCTGSSLSCPSRMVLSAFSTQTTLSVGPTSSPVSLSVFGKQVLQLPRQAPGT